jgi:hypothetical protein
LRTWNWLRRATCGDEHSFYERRRQRFPDQQEERRNAGPCRETPTRDEPMGQRARRYRHHEARRRTVWGGVALTTSLRSMSTETPFGGGGSNAERGMEGPRQQLKSFSQRRAPGALPEIHRSATCHGTMTSARCSRLPGAVRRRSRATEIANGGLATTRKGRRGSRTSLPSAQTTTTLELANF